jgi:hypothetical protein
MFATLLDCQPGPGFRAIDASTVAATDCNHGLDLPILDGAWLD